MGAGDLAATGEGVDSSLGERTSQTSCQTEFSVPCNVPCSLFHHQWNSWLQWAWGGKNDVFLMGVRRLTASTSRALCILTGMAGRGQREPGFSRGGGVLLGKTALCWWPCYLFILTPNHEPGHHAIPSTLNRSAGECRRRSSYGFIGPFFWAVFGGRWL